jgi:hypothetical protein
MKDEIQPIILPPEGKGRFWKGYKNRRTRLLNKIKSISGVNPELLGPYEPKSPIEKPTPRTEYGQDVRKV